ncbi:MAG: hypothetical protein ACREOO_27410 [bacterium]
MKKALKVLFAMGLLLALATCERTPMRSDNHAEELKETEIMQDPNILYIKVYRGRVTLQNGLVFESDGKRPRIFRIPEEFSPFHSSFEKVDSVLLPGNESLSKVTASCSPSWLSFTGCVLFMGCCSMTIYGHTTFSYFRYNLLIDGTEDYHRQKTRLQNFTVNAGTTIRLTNYMEDVLPSGQYIYASSSSLYQQYSPGTHTLETPLTSCQHHPISNDNDYDYVEGKIENTGTGSITVSFNFVSCGNGHWFNYYRYPF